MLRPQADAAGAGVPASVGKKRALPSWAGGAGGGSGAPAPAKRVSPPKSASVWSPASRNSGGRGSGSGSGSRLFTPSYATTPSPQASSASSSRKLPSSAASTKVFTPPSSHGPSPRSTASKEPAAAAATVSPPTAAARLFTPSYAPSASVAGKARRQPGDAAVAGVGNKPEPWTPEFVLRLIKEAGPSGASFEVIHASLSFFCRFLVVLLDVFRCFFLCGGVGISLCRYRGSAVGYLFASLPFPAGAAHLKNRRFTTGSCCVSDILSSLSTRPDAPGREVHTPNYVR